MHTETGEALDQVGAQCGTARHQGEGDATYRARIISTGGPAFGGLKQVGECSIKTGGVTVRDYFAAKALQSLVASVGQHSVGLAGSSAMYGTPEIHARSAYAYADAMLAARGESK